MTEVCPMWRHRKIEESLEWGSTTVITRRSDAGRTGNGWHDKEWLGPERAVECVARWRPGAARGARRQASSQAPAGGQEQDELYGSEQAVGHGAGGCLRGVGGKQCRKAGDWHRAGGRASKGARPSVARVAVDAGKLLAQTSGQRRRQLALVGSQRGRAAGVGAEQCGRTVGTGRQYRGPTIGAGNQLGAQGERRGVAQAVGHWAVCSAGWQHVGG